MQPSRILPDLQCSLLCEDVRQEANGKFLLIGVLNFIPVPQVPITAHRLLFYNRWTAGVGEFLQTIRLIAPDQVTELSKSETKFALGEPAAYVINVAVFGNVTFSVAGIYFVEVLVDGVMKIRYPLPVAIVPPPGANPQAPPAKPGAV
jgi:hypothetical protein